MYSQTPGARAPVPHDWRRLWYKIIMAISHWLPLLQVSDELFVAHEMLCSRLVNRQQQPPPTDFIFIDGHLANYQTLVNSRIDSVIKVASMYLSFLYRYTSFPLDTSEL